ncbi:E3 ubiquitin-protein ligase MYLIP-A-like [Macrobrachium rosenbergii]|uniref:E3 ubiquitin-protein ligase MYLIP-A-like n=1 Tax=Macrobrachium rosenbergii TaxID=79674 RepID=UPI0034D5BCBC
MNRNGMDHDGLGVRVTTDSVDLGDQPTMESLEAEKKKLKVRLDEAREALICRVCLDKPVAAVFMPCAHLNSCQACSMSLTLCPVCRSPIHYAAPVIID